MARACSPDNSPMQEIYDQAEDLVDALDIASGCIEAVMTALVRIAATDSEMRHAIAVTVAAQHYLKDVRAHGDRIARLTMT